MGFDREHGRLSALVEDLREDEALALIHALLAAGDDPLALIDSCQQGMHQVGVRYQQGEYFIAGLIMAGEILRQVVEIVQPRIQDLPHRQVSGSMLLGTVEGDIHDLGKDIVKILLRCNGLEVVDLGVDVPSERFIRQARTLKPRIIGISVLITSAFDNLERTIAQLRADAELKPLRIPIVIGGGQLDETVCRAMGADAWTDDAMRGVDICLRLLKSRRAP